MLPTYTPGTSSNSSDDASGMKLVYFGNEFPTHDWHDVLRRLHNLSKDRRHHVLAQFISEATWAIKDEVEQLPTEVRQVIPPFRTIVSWADDEELRESSLSSVVDGVLLVLVQLATYISCVETRSEGVADYSHSCAAGLGLGLLASAAVSVSPTLAELPLAGADALRLAFRFNMHVLAVSENLELSPPTETWAYVVHNVDATAAQEELDTLQAEGEIAEASKIFISAIGQTSVTVSGPPSRLKATLAKSRLFRAGRVIALPVYGGLCHAPHVFNQQDIAQVMECRGFNSSGPQFWPVMSFLSTGSGQPYLVKDALQMFECVVSELLTHAVYWDRVIDSLVDRVKSSGASDLALYCLGHSTHLNQLRTTLEQGVSHVQVAVNDMMALVLQPGDSGPRGSAQSKLAIVGMACRLPGGADTTDKFWEVLEKGLDVSQRVPADRFDIDAHYDATGKEQNKVMTQYGCFVDNPGFFDASFFNMSPREAQVVDPQMRLALVTAYEALERAGFVGDRTASTKLQRIGTFYGQAADDYREVNQGQEVSTYYIPGGCRAFGPGRINYFFKFAGPSYSIDTACSSGLAAIEVACQALWSGQIDTAVAGGVNILTNPDCFAGLCHGHFLTKGHNACKTWDATADGYCRAEGIGSLVIKRLEDAEADNDRILGVILGAGTNHSAQAVSITHPHAGHQSDLARQVLGEAGVNPLQVSYVELHGTGTQAGDHEEMEATTQVYAPLTRRRTKDQPLHIGAVKANVGHGESVAGTTALIKVLLMLEKQAIPPHIGIKTEFNPKLPQDLAERNVNIAFKQTPWPHVSGQKRIAVVNNFGAAGGNTTMLLEEPLPREAGEPDVRPLHVVAVSAKSKASLAANIERLMAHIEQHPDMSLADLSYTTTARKSHYSNRVAFASPDLAHVKKQLASRLDTVQSSKPVSKSDPPSVAFAFTGQGASHKSMSLELYRDVPSFRHDIERLDLLARRQGLPSFIPAIDGSHAKEHAHSPVVTQLALVCTQMALAKYWASLGVKPDVVIGHSLGEYAAMYVAGVVSASDTIFMVGRRAQMLSDRCQMGSHTMMAVRASLAQIAESAQGKPHTIACVNGPSDTVLSGTKDEMDSVALHLEAAGFRCIKLDVAFAFHSEQMDPILDDFEALVKAGVVFQEPKLPVISPLLGRVIFEAKSLNATYVRRATRETVDFLAALENAQQVSTVGPDTIWIEIGPHPVCTGFVKSTMAVTALAAASMRRGDDNWKTMAETMTALHLAGLGVSWNEFHRPFESRLGLVDLPTYAWNDKNYWVQYNGDWCLTKGNTFYQKASETRTKAAVSKFSTSTVQQIIQESFNGSAGSVVMQSDMMQPDFLAAAWGHRMNDCGVVTSSIHADLSYTLGSYLYRKLAPKAKEVPHMNMANLVVTKGLVAQKDTSTSQLFRVSISTAALESGVADLTWQVVDKEGKVDEPFATANIFYGNASEWLCSWASLAHLVHGRIEALEQLAAQGQANRFSRNMAYTIFASNLVGYADKYRGMQSVVMHGLEAFADVTLCTNQAGVWTVAPHFIDSVVHLAGFVMNCSDAMDTANNFCVTPGWRSMRFAKPLLPGAKFQSYVKMIPTAEDPSIYLGDVYILQQGAIVGLVEDMQFRRYPRILLSRFFSAPDAGPKPAAAPKAVAAVAAASTAASTAAAAPKAAETKAETKPKEPEGTPAAAAGQAPAAQEATGIPAKALMLIARETALDVSVFVDDASFSDFGVDSLLSLVIAEKFRIELGVKVGGSLFLDYPTIGDLRKWLEEYS
ncbi:hypothetical protein CDD81_2073 [Ophiocordyceps australis]|uniref:Uncharacterized protein n=1 Tax=Ophiocordyceps australis TaxID=1399860 RepID=A0A2C5XSB2_9HYPO|nr:hypothetical protein CDD81_2073 [Ophiocordyceps australis]